MRNLTSTVSICASLAAMALWFPWAIATKAAVEDPTTSVAARFPATQEAFRPARPVADPVQHASMETFWGMSSGSVAPCGDDWPFLAANCFAVAKPVVAKPVTRLAAALPPTSPAARPIDGEPSSVAPASPTSIAPACRQNLATASTRLEQARAHLNGRLPGGMEACATYRRDFFEVVRARETTSLCKTGTEREHDLGSIDAAVESINGAIAASCNG